MSELAKKESSELQSAQAITPMQMLQVAVEQGADLDKLQKLMDLQERWEANEARKAYVAAMSKFRKGCPTIGKDREGHNCKYAGLAETIEQIKDLLTKNGLSHSWQTKQENNVTEVTCCVTHVMGHKECTSLSAAPDTSGSKNSIQAIGSTISYLERYTLFAILGLASREMDDDGADSEPVEYINEDQVLTILALIEEVQANSGGFCKYFKIDSVEKLPKQAMKDAVRMLEQKRKRS